jgi:hypothetical protein
MLDGGWTDAGRRLDGSREGDGVKTLGASQVVRGRAKAEEKRRRGGEEEQAERLPIGWPPVCLCVDLTLLTLGGPLPTLVFLPDSFFQFP